MRGPRRPRQVPYTRGPRYRWPRRGLAHPGTAAGSGDRGESHLMAKGDLQMCPNSILEATAPVCAAPLQVALPPWVGITVIMIVMLIRVGQAVVTQIIRLRTAGLLRPEDALPVLLAHRCHHRWRGTRPCQCRR